MDKLAARHTVAKCCRGNKVENGVSGLGEKQTQNRHVGKIHTALMNIKQLLHLHKLSAVRHDGSVLVARLQVASKRCKVYMCLLKLQCIWVWRLLCQLVKRWKQISPLEGWKDFVWETAHRWKTYKSSPRPSRLVPLGLANWSDFVHLICSWRRRRPGRTESILW